MFGIYRYGLACCVVASHLYAGMIGGPAAYAVWGFYCLSGYLMTLILNEKYGFSFRGVAAYAANRALRIYPGYYAVCAIMFLIFLTIPSTASRFLPALTMPVGFDSWLYVSTLLARYVGGELVHGSSALHVELLFYILMGLGLARSRSIAALWFIGSVGYTVYQLKTGVPFAERYFWPRACSLAFSTGSLIYHFKKYLPVIRRPEFAFAAAIGWWVHVWLSWKLPGGPWIYGLYTSLAASAVALVALINLEPKRVHPVLARIDRLAGDLSYPMYLCHWAVGVLTIALFPGLSRDSIWVFIVGFPVVNVLSYAIYRLVEKPFQSWKFAGAFEPRRPRAIADFAASESVRLDSASHANPQPHVSVAAESDAINSEVKPPVEA